MSGPLTALWDFQKRTFARYKYEIKRVLKERPRGSALWSNDAGALTPDWNINKLLEAARNLLAAHIPRQDNPHQETIVTIGSYPPADVHAALDQKIPLGVMPFSSYAILEFPTPQEIMDAWQVSGFTITCTKVFKATLSGSPYDMPIKSINLATVSADPTNKVFQIFVRQRFGVVDYMAQEDSPPESMSVMWIGSVYTGSTGIIDKIFYPVTRVDTFRTSTEARGSVIPVAMGTIDNPVKFPATWNPL